MQKRVVKKKKKYRKDQIKQKCPLKKNKREKVRLQMNVA